MFLAEFQHAFAGYVRAVADEEADNFVNELRLGQSALDAGRDLGSDFLQLGKRLEPECVEIDVLGHGEGSRRLGDSGGWGIGNECLGGLFGCVRHGDGWESFAVSLDLRPEGVGPAVVPEDDVGASFLFLQGHLGGEDGLDQGIIPTVASLESGDLCGAGGGDGDCPGLAEIEAVFEKQRDIRQEAPRPFHSGLIAQSKTFLSHPRMQNSLQKRPFAGICENDATKFRAIDGSRFLIENAIAEKLREFLGDRFAL